MTLGGDGAVCTDELVEAMRARLEAEDPALVANVERDDVKKNFAALGAGLHAVLTKPGRAETYSDETDDGPFWDWVTAVTAQTAALTAWQAGLRAAVEVWQPADPAGKQLRKAVLDLGQVGPAPAPAPTSLAGRIT